MNEITPDFIVENHNGELTLSMNQRDVPNLRINHEYSDMFCDYTGNKTNRSPEMRNAVQFVKQKLDAAQWFINAVRQRQKTLQRTEKYLLRDNEIDGKTLVFSHKIRSSPCKFFFHKF